MKAPAVYIMASKRNGTLYTGVTADLSRRVYEHKQALNPSFTEKHLCTLLVWYENYDRMDEAIAREKQIKGGSRKAKLRLVERHNPDWRNLYFELA
jgi:predicted GIY-YIG superfamily endonuclease